MVRYFFALQGTKKYSRDKKEPLSNYLKEVRGLHLDTKTLDLEKMIEIQKKIVPEVAEMLLERYNILRFIHYNQPIGRRSLSNVMGLGERIIRSEVNFLKEQDFIEIRAEGMNTTQNGENTLEMLRSIIHSFKGLSNLEEEVLKKLGIRKVMIIPGLEKTNHVVLKEIGRVAGNYLKSIIKPDMVIGVTGGDTMAMLAEEMIDEPSKNLNITVVPGRGGMGREVEKQANTIAAKIAKKLKVSYKLLHMPDNISKDLLMSLSEDPSIKEVMDYLQRIDIFIFGIGRADTLARRRELDEKVIDLLKKKGAVAEAFGYYFDKQGSIVYEVNTVGVRLEHYKRLRNVVGAAAGEDKAEAIIAFSRLNKNLVLTIDEGLAKEIIKYEY